MEPETSRYGWNSTGFSGTPLTCGLCVWCLADSDQTGSSSWLCPPTSDTSLSRPPRTLQLAAPLASRSDWVTEAQLRNHFLGLVTRSISVRTGSWIRVGFLRGREVAWNWTYGSVRNFLSRLLDCDRKSATANSRRATPHSFASLHLLLPVCCFAVDGCFAGLNQASQLHGAAHLDCACSRQWWPFVLVFFSWPSCRARASWLLRSRRWLVKYL